MGLHLLGVGGVPGLQRRGGRGLVELLEEGVRRLYEAADRLAVGPEPELLLELGELRGALVFRGGPEVPYLVDLRVVELDPDYVYRVYVVEVGGARLVRMGLEVDLEFVVPRLLVELELRWGGEVRRLRSEGVAGLAYLLLPQVMDEYLGGRVEVEGGRRLRDLLDIVVGYGGGLARGEDPLPEAMWSREVVAARYRPGAGLVGVGLSCWRCPGRLRLVVSRGDAPYLDALRLRWGRVEDAESPALEALLEVVEEAPRALRAYLDAARRAYLGLLAYAL